MLNMKSSLILAVFAIVHLNCFSQVSETKPHYIGEKFGGGVIFYIDGSGQHGLIARRSDEPIAACWGNSSNIDASFMNEGDRNTKIIVDFMKSKDYHACEMPAACMCDTVTKGGFKDWYLPAINELKLMYDNQQIIGNFSAWDYCSSTECDWDQCWCIHFRPNRKVIFHYKKYFSNFFVRCIRKF